MLIASDHLIGEIASQLENKDYYQELNVEQRKVVAHDKGPLLVIAGPGSGKTRCLTLRAMNLLLLYGGPLCQDTKIGLDKSYFPPFHACVCTTFAHGLWKYTSAGVW